MIETNHHRMQLSKEDIEEFKSIHEEESGEEITFAEASEMANRLIALYEVLANPIPSSTDHHNVQ